MRKSTVSLSIACLTFATVSSVVLSGQPAANDGPRYENGTHLVRPDDYREWTFLSSGLAMAYNEDQPAGASTRPQLFQNVFVNPSSHRAFMETGRWPDGTTFVLEFRRAATDAELAKVLQEPPTDEEIAGVKNRIEASHYRQLAHIGVYSQTLLTQFPERGAGILHFRHIDVRHCYLSSIRGKG